MKFAHFSHVWNKPGMTAAARYEQLWRELALADESGFDFGFCVEHHFNPNESWMPSPSIYCAAAAARTRRLRIGTMGNIVPLYDPLRIAEDAAVLDNVANGRFELGLVSGIVPDFFGPYGADFQNRRALTHEALLFIKQALSSDGAFSFTGESRQYQERHTRRKAAAKTPSADLDSLARRRHAGVARARRRAHRLSISWCRATKSRRAIANIYGCGMTRVMQANRTSATGCSSMLTRPTPKPWRKQNPISNTVSPRFSAPELTVGSVISDWRKTTPNAAIPAAPRSRVTRSMSIICVTRNLAFVGSPPTVIEQIKAAAREGVFNTVMGEFNIGAIAEEDLMRSIKLFGIEVIPALRDFEPY